MIRLWLLMILVGLVAGVGCSSPEPDTSSPDNYMSPGSSMEPDPEIVKQKEAEAAGRSVGNREGSGGATKGG